MSPRPLGCWKTHSQRIGLPVTASCEVTQVPGQGSAHELNLGLVTQDHCWHQTSCPAWIPHTGTFTSQEFSTGIRTTKHQHRTAPPKHLGENIPVPSQAPNTAPALTSHFQTLLSPHTFLTARCKNEPWPEGSWRSPNSSFAALPFYLFCSHQPTIRESF